MKTLLLTLILTISAQAKTTTHCNIKIKEKGITRLISSSEISAYFEATPKSCPLPKKGEDPKKLCQSQNHGTILELFNGTKIEAESSFKSIEDQIVACNI